jgi:hypothetical protein
VRQALVVAVIALGAAAPAARAQAAAPLDSAAIHTTLRAFYFNLAHDDWEAIAADVLSAKVVAHRPAPEALVARAVRSRPAGASCSSGATAPVERPVLARQGDWVEASVTRCAAGRSVTDEFRLVRFEGRWRVVYIDLGAEPASDPTLQP